MALAYGEFGRELGLRLDEARKKLGLSQEGVWLLYATQAKDEGIKHKSALTLRNNLVGKVAMDPVHYNLGVRALNPLLEAQGEERLPEAVLSFRDTLTGEELLDLRVKQDAGFYPELATAAVS